MSRFQTMYHDVIVPELTKKFGYKTIMQVPASPRSPSTWVSVKP